MSGSVRARRPASPPLGLPQTISTSQRFPHQREDHLDADARKAAASKGFMPGRNTHAPGGLGLPPGEWKLLILIVLVASGVRLFRLAQPNSVV
jgi:dolichyl-phosphate-mannose-protein mannosyltransferase